MDISGHANTFPANIPRLLPDLYQFDIVLEPECALRLIGHLGLGVSGAKISKSIDGERRTVMEELFDKAVETNQPLCSHRGYSFRSKKLSHVRRTALALRYLRDDIATVVAGQNFEEPDVRRHEHLPTNVRTLEYGRKTLEVSGSQHSRVEPSRQQRRRVVPASMDRSEKVDAGFLTAHSDTEQHDRLPTKAPSDG